MLIDPRASVVPGVRISRNGSLFWFDSNGDGIYEDAYVFTSETRKCAVPQAVGVFIDGNLDKRMDVDAVLARSADLADSYFPLSWLSGGEGYFYITGKAYEDAWADYLKSQQDPAVWCRMIADTNFQIANMLGMMALGAAIGSCIAPPWGTLVGLVVGFVVGRPSRTRSRTWSRRQCMVTPIGAPTCSTTARWRASRS